MCSTRPRIAAEARDLLLLSNDLRDVVTAIELSQATMSKIHQNIFWSLVYDSLSVPIAALARPNLILVSAEVPKHREDQLPRLTGVTA